MEKDKIISEKDAEAVTGGSGKCGAIAKGTTCRICGEKLGTLTLLRKHMREVHQIVE